MLSGIRPRFFQRSDTTGREPDEGVGDGFEYGHDTQEDGGDKGDVGSGETKGVGFCFGR